MFKKIHLRVTSVLMALFLFSGFGFITPTVDADFGLKNDPTIGEIIDNGLFEDDGSEHGMWNQYGKNNISIFPAPDEEVEDDGTEWD